MFVKKSLYTLEVQSNKHKMNTQILTNAEKIIYNYSVKFWIKNGLSKTDAEKKAFEKLNKISKLKNDKSIIRF